MLKLGMWRLTHRSFRTQILVLMIYLALSIKVIGSINKLF